LFPLSNGFAFSAPFLIMFERGKELERGLRPLSFKLPSPAINTCGLLPVILAGEGVRGEASTASQMQTKPFYPEKIDKRKTGTLK